MNHLWPSKENSVNKLDLEKQQSD
jgi:hypothetical protein